MGIYSDLKLEVEVYLIWEYSGQNNYMPYLDLFHVFVREVDITLNPILFWVSKLVFGLEVCHMI